jgi:hypothetical protein
MTIGAALLTVSPVAAADTFTVRSTADDGDVHAGDGVCDSASGAAVVCTLRAAITEANADPDRDRIAFGIDGPGEARTRVIAPARDLPSIDAPLVVDGYSQPGASANTSPVGTDARLRIVLAGPGDGTGLTARADVAIRGLVIRDFEVGIVVLGPKAVITGNFIGTDATGTSAAGNGIGVLLLGSGRVGGTEAADRNLISGNETGISATGPSSDRIVRGNLIGTRANGTEGLGNGVGIRLDDGGLLEIGGEMGGSGNVIAFNGGPGIVIDNITGSARSLISRNSIFRNAGPGIDLEADGVSANDDNPPLESAPPPDTDAGGNDLQNHPLITSARSGRSRSIIRGTLRTDPGKSFRLELFSSPSGSEGKSFVGSRTVATTGNGIANWRYRPDRRVRVGHVVTATVTDLSDGETSEFSQPRRVSRRR